MSRPEADTGSTFVTLLRRTRWRRLPSLQTTTLSMKEIAGRAGFSSASDSIALQDRLRRVAFRIPHRVLARSV